MSRKRQLVKIINKITKQVSKHFLSPIKKKIVWLLRTLFVTKRRRSSANAGFVLPTVAMVSVVVVLLSTAIVFRSFERAKNSGNVRVNEAVMNAAMPGIDRARAKLEQLLSDPALPRSTPTDLALYGVIKNSKYDFGDETRLRLAQDFNGTAGIQPSTTLEDDETLNTAWKFPVDTDNNGKFDSFTLYAIYFRSPTRDTSNQFDRARTPLDARTPPMDQSQIGGACAGAIGTSASLIGDSSWYKAGSNLAKSFFVYTVNVPIDALGTLLDDTKYETKASRGFSALEYQQDRERIPVNNKAVWFENDLEIAPGGELLLNGSIHTNGNLLAGTVVNGQIIYRQVSSKNSCYYEQENAKITVGGNLGTAGVNGDADTGALRMDLFRGYKVDPWTTDQTAPNASKIIIGGDTGHKSTTAGGGQTVSHNDAAYNERISKMKQEALDLCTTCAAATTVTALNTAVAAVGRYPEEIKDNFDSRVTLSTTDIDLETAQDILGEEIENYLRDRTRRVPFAEVAQAIPTAAEALGTYETAAAFTGTGEIEVPAEWREITTTNTGLTLNLDKLEATEPEKQSNDGTENYAGDRVLIGNNLPAFWKNSDNAYGTGQKFRQPVDSTTYWNSSDTPNEVRTRASQIQPQLSLGQTGRNQFWEEKAVEDDSANPLSNVGGLRVITGAGIYVDDDGLSGTGSFPRSADSLPPTLDTSFVGSSAGQMPAPLTFDAPLTAVSNIFVWPDTMPMSSPTSALTGDLLMRATAVYHFKDNAGTAQTPIACVSSYYDPTNNITAQNEPALTTSWINPSAADPTDPTTIGKSNNGIVYPPADRTSITTNLATLTRQARLVFPNGRIANEPLRKAIKKYTDNGSNFDNFTMENYSAVDTALCALSIINGATPAATPVVPHGAIREASFLDAREVKALQPLEDRLVGVVLEKGYRNDDNDSEREYNLDLEQRQPLEIRVTELDLGQLAATSIASTEYLLPKSGIIYATRDDALPDLSYATIEPGDLNDPQYQDKIKLFSQTDFKLDPTRRPNGIRLINGVNLARTGTNTATYDPSEKGLILASNLPVYIKGEFNLHKIPGGTTQIEEFTALETTANFYTRSGFNNNFACRPGRGACPTGATTGDLWRPSTVLADALTLLSGGFQDGFRSDGDYDLNDNAASIPKSNSPADVVNYFATNISSSWGGTAGSPNTKTSYNANGVTPIQRRAEFNEYLMEVCPKVPASTCDQDDPNDWKVFIRSDTTPRTATEVLNDFTTINIDGFVNDNLASGTTALPPFFDPDDPPDVDYSLYPRRVAFYRDGAGNLLDKDDAVIDAVAAAAGKLPVPIGIEDITFKVQKFPYGVGTPKPRLLATALWFQTSNSNTNPNTPASKRYAANLPLFLQSLPSGTQQPKLVPILQIYSPQGTPGTRY